MKFIPLSQQLYFDKNDIAAITDEYTEPTKGIWRNDGTHMYTQVRGKSKLQVGNDNSISSMLIKILYFFLKII